MSRSKKILVLARNINPMKDLPVEIDGVTIVENVQNSVVVLGKFVNT